MSVQSAKVIIVGSGFAGLGMAIQLKKAGIHDFLLLERADDVGGAWRDNHYPGCACDVQSLLYSFSFEPKHDWSHKFAKSGEIYAYLQHCAAKYGLYPHIRFGRSLVSAEFQAQSGEWLMADDAGRQYRCQFMVSALGPLSNPIIPSFDGLDDFAGAKFHSAQWQHDYDMRGKRVAIVGSGASTIQFLPEVAKEAASVTLFQRTAPWVMPKPDRQVSRFEKLLFRFVPGLQRLLRAGIYWRAELFLKAYLNTNSWMHGFGERQIRKYVEASFADEELRDKVMPKFKLGCKRTLLSNDYYPALNRDNVSVVNHAVAKVSRDGVIDAQGLEHKVDAIIFGTGFRVDDPLSGVTVTGLRGRNLNEEWQQNGFASYYGTCISGYPNMLVLAGPNTGIGHTSLVYMLEQQIAYAVKYICEAGAEGNYLDVNVKAQDDFHQDLQAAFPGTAWASGCDSWYLTQGGKNFTIWPSYTYRYAEQLASLKMQDYSRGYASTVDADVLVSLDADAIQAADITARSGAIA